ncbi:MAG: hypothetical protein P1U46_01235 [Patescibacteria group bacterium]|nr:hypothetical protein [Patescibacteria group bacterium]
MKKFHIGDVLSIITGRLLSPEGIGGVYKILNHMTGDKLFTHQLPRASDQCKPKLLEQYPALKDVDLSSVNGENYKAFVAEQAEKFGEFLEVPTLSQEEYQHKDPILEYQEMMAR